MVALSLIVPVYRVERYLPECLDSVLSQPAGRAIELIAVDDASPDDGGEILARYAAGDDRVRVITLPRNGGLGVARNTGLDHARGDYVWFVDGDDWLPPDCLTAVLDRLGQVRPDMLIVDYVRSYPDGRDVRFSAADIYPDPLPVTFALADRPALLRSLHIACNKVVRREFLLATGIRFLAGWYEDVSFSLPLLLSATRLSVLTELSYCYRQRPEGSITSTVDERHFQVFGQWQRVFGYLDEHPELDPLRPAVFARMVWHLLAVLHQPERVPPDRRRAFFGEMSQLYRRHLPAAGYPVPAGTAGVAHRFVARGSYRLYQSARSAELARRRLAAMGGRIRSATRPDVH